MTIGKLTTWKSVAAVAVMLAVSSSFPVVADGQELVSPTRGGVKVRSRIVIAEPAKRGSVAARSRFFNPFEVTSQSRLSLNPFGLFTVAPLPAPAAPAASAAAELPAIAAPADLEAATSSSTISQASSVLDEGGTGVGASVRPPYRPPVRSPFRPPPRPPF